MKIAQKSIGDTFFGSGTFLQNPEDVGTLTTNLVRAALGVAGIIFVILLIGGGILVGLGTRISGGCTSGHGISGVGRFSLRSIIATITFMIVGILTVLIKNIS